MPFTHSAGPALNIDSPSSEPSTSATKPGSPSTPSLTLVTGSGWMRAVVALIDLDRPAIWVSYDEAAPPLAVLVTAEHLDPKRLQRRHHRIQRGHPHADKTFACGSLKSKAGTEQQALNVACFRALCPRQVVVPSCATMTWTSELS